MKKIFANELIRYLLMAAAGLLTGWILFHVPQPPAADKAVAQTTKISEIWTCAMHPQIRMELPGKCPICAMELILLNRNSVNNVDPSVIRLTKEAAQLANVRTTLVTGQRAVREVRLYGKVQADERLIRSQVAYFPGRIEKLLVSFTGEMVSKGQPLANIYSPELLTAQQELLEAVKSKLAQPEIYEAAREKLRQWKLPDSLIASLEKTGTVEPYIEIKSTTSGIVTSRRVNSGDYVGQGTVLFEISDLSSVWVQFDAYESDLQFLNKGNKIDFTIQALAGEKFTGEIRFIDPTMDAVSRIARVRVEMSNPSGKLKPEMFATGVVQAKLGESAEQIVVPRSAVLWTGKRSLVYVRIPGKEPVFKARIVELGPMLGDNYLLTGGMQAGEEIVTEGAFSVDAASQLEGKPSMMNGEAPSPDGVTLSHPVRMPEIGTSGTRKQLKIKVYGNCEMCKERIEKITSAMEGVSDANWNLTDKFLTLNIDPSRTGSDKIQQRLAASGHDTELYKAGNEVYNNLPDCCKYERRK